MGIFVNGKLTNFYEDGKLVRPFEDGKQLVPSQSTATYDSTGFAWNFTNSNGQYLFALGVDKELVLAAPNGDASLLPPDDGLKMITLNNVDGANIFSEVSWTFTSLVGYIKTWTTSQSVTVPSAGTDIEAFFSVVFP